MKKYRQLEYMADAYIEAWGDDLEETFINAALGFYDTMINVDSVDVVENLDISVSGADLQELLYNWIEELIYIFETRGFVASKFNIKIYRENSKWKLAGRIYGEKYNKNKHGSKTHIKAVTYHAMEIARDKKGIKIRYLLDL